MSKREWFGDPISLIRAVQKHPDLWDKQSPHYRKNKATSMLWQLILDELKIPRSVNYQKIREEWKKIEGRFWRATTKVAQTGGGLEQLDITLRQCCFLIKPPSPSSTINLSSKQASSNSNNSTASSSSIKQNNSEKVGSKAPDMNMAQFSCYSESKHTSKVYKSLGDKRAHKDISKELKPDKKPKVEHKVETHKEDAQWHKQNSASSDPDYLFAMQIYNRLRELTPVCKNQAQIEILQVFQKIYIKQ